MSHPYQDLPNYCSWFRAVTWEAPGRLDPVTTCLPISVSERIATIGSCFAQHLARHMRQTGLNHFVTEPAPMGCPVDEALRRNFGVFSARYGNVYTVRQALQLFDRAFGQFDTTDDVWRRGDRFVDAFRPQVEPDGWASPDEVRADRTAHLAAVRATFAEADWFFFTLGLTEAWRSRVDGAVYPTAPGVAGGEFDPEKHEFVNFTVTEVRDDLFALVRRIGRVNPGLRIVLTVSPVPLIATYERRHVLVSTTVSKATLRVAADEAERAFEQVTYFPSYEIITAPHPANPYYDDTLRGVTELGVRHVMRVFSRAVSDRPGSGERVSESLDTTAPSTADVVCDEEIIERAVRVASQGVLP